MRESDVGKIIHQPISFVAHVANLLQTYHVPPLTILLTHLPKDPMFHGTC